jgi:hypothetical protein
MYSYLPKLPSWIGRHYKAADADNDFGLDLDATHGMMTANGELLVYGVASPTQKMSDSPSYGTIAGQKSNISSDAFADIFGKFYRNSLQAFAALAVIWVLFLFLHHHLRFLSTPSSASSMKSPSPSMSSAPTCSDYKYPQCEAAMEWYLSRNAANRCEAFEHVKAEGDLFKFPYSTSQQDMCDLGRSGCCGCPGQCSKCPPLLAECVSWRLDGSWQIAFTEGSDSRYTFDAHGHYQLDLPSSSLPVSWKSWDQAFIPNGSDLGPPQLISVSDAKNRCRQDPRCKGITYDEASNIGNNVYEVFFKLVSTVVAAPGTGWKTFVEEERPELHERVAVAGPLQQTGLNASGAFRLDLHSAAPQLFPHGCFEQLTVKDDELHVERQCPGTAMQIGQGLRTK